MVAMEPPLSHRPGDLHLEKNKVLKALRKYKPEEVAQETIKPEYLHGMIKGELAKGATLKKMVSEPLQKPKPMLPAACSSITGAGAAYPFYLRAGKRLDRNITEIVVNFKVGPPLYFSDPYRQN